MDIRMINLLKDEISNLERPLTFMEVCGTHTMEIGKLGIRSLFQNKIKLISGPGCPVCVTPSSDIDYIYYLALKQNLSIITYGDMLRVPGSNRNITLEKARAQGADINIVYSAIDAIEFAKKNQNKSYVFIAIGFETTIPSTLILMDEIVKNDLKNIFILSLHKSVEPVMRNLILDKEMKIDGFLCPGNVAVILGEDGFEFIKELGTLGVIAGFSNEGIISSFIELIRNRNKRGVLINNYKEFTRKEANEVTGILINKYLTPSSSKWRGIGLIDKSGYEINNKYGYLDITNVYPKKEVQALGLLKLENNVCMCGEILKGKITPKECPSFKKECTPAYPIGPCMVSSEGTCAAFYKYGN